MQSEYGFPHLQITTYLTPREITVVRTDPLAFRGKEIDKVNVEQAPYWYFSNTNFNLIEDKQLSNELACFSGNLTKLILGEPYPTYYAGIIDGSNPDPEDGDYFRVTCAIPNFTRWFKNVVLNEEENTIQVLGQTYPLKNHPFVGLTSMLVVGSFVNEIDWDEQNIGLIPRPDGKYLVLRVDPGQSFKKESFFNETEEEIKEKLGNLLNFLINQHEPESDSERESDEDSEREVKGPRGPFAEYASHENEDAIDAMFNSPNELYATLARIISLPKSFYIAQAKQDFSEENLEWAYTTLIPGILNRIQNYQNVAFTYQGFINFYNQYFAANALSYYQGLI